NIFIFFNAYDNSFNWERLVFLPRQTGRASHAALLMCIIIIICTPIGPGAIRSIYVLSSLYMMYPICFTQHKLPTSEILVFLKCWFFPSSFANICLDSG